MFFASKILKTNHFIKNETKKPPTKFIDNSLNTNTLDYNFKFLSYLNKKIYICNLKKIPYRKGLHLYGNNHEIYRIPH